MKTKTLLITFSMLFSTLSQAGLVMTYHQLALKDLDQMVEFVNSKIKESKKSYAGKTVPLKEALQAVLGRPNEDSMVEKVISPLKSELDSHNAWEKSIKELTTEAVNALRLPKNFRPEVQVTYGVFLENLIAELKPNATAEGFDRKMLEKIRDAKIELSKEAQNERALRMMKSTVSPSEIADMVLKSTKVEVQPSTTTTPTAAPVATPEKTEGHEFE
jgi:hypothetical protein